MFDGFISKSLNVKMKISCNDWSYVWYFLFIFQFLKTNVNKWSTEGELLVGHTQMMSLWYWTSFLKVTNLLMTLNLYIYRKLLMLVPEIKYVTDFTAVLFAGDLLIAEDNESVRDAKELNWKMFVLEQIHSLVNNKIKFNQDKVYKIFETICKCLSLI